MCQRSNTTVQFYGEFHIIIFLMMITSVIILLFYLGDYFSTATALSEEIVKHINTVGDYYKGSGPGASLPTSHSSGNLSAQDLFVDKALSSSLLVYENTKVRISNVFIFFEMEWAFSKTNALG